MPITFRFIAASWTFFLRQTAVQRSTAILVFLPLCVIGFLNQLIDIENQKGAAILVVLFVLSIVLLTWGVACTLVVGKRLLQAKSGRLRTSFKAVSSQARGLIAGLLLTDILRGCIAMLWALPAVGLAIVAIASLSETSLDNSQPFLYLAGICFLLILPLIYLLRTTFAPFLVVYEKLAFRDALRRSKELTQGRLSGTLAITAILGLFWLPGLAFEILMMEYADPTVAFFTVPFVSGFLDTLALTTWLLSLTQFYKALGGKAKATKDDDE